MYYEDKDKRERGKKTGQTQMKKGMERRGEEEKREMKKTREKRGIRDCGK